MPNPVWKETERGGGEAVHVQQHENARRREPSKGSRTPRRNLAFLSFHHVCVNAPAGVVVTATSTNKHQISLLDVRCVDGTRACRRHRKRLMDRQERFHGDHAPCHYREMHRTYTLYPYTLTPYTLDPHTLYPYTLDPFTLDRQP